VTELYRVYDASRPPDRPYPNCEGVAGYIGGNTPHVWTAEEWNRASDNGRLAMLPIWVGFGEADPAGHAHQAAIAAVRLGWAARHSPRWRAIVLDVENVSEQPWIIAFGDTLRSLGFLCWPYMSASALPSDPAGYTVWLALWDGKADIPANHDVIGHQFAHDLPWRGTAVDLSVFTAEIMLRSFGRGPRR
jgi:hypothetical protein